jgi:hypothetical protein
MQMTISTTGRRRLCILRFVYVLSKMLKLCGAEGSSFRFWGVLSVLVAEAASWFCWGSPDWCCWGGILFPVRQLWVWSLDAVSPLLLRQRPGVLSDSLIVGCCQNSLRQWFNAECAELRLVRWWACSGSNRLCSCLGPNRSLCLRWVRGWWCQSIVWLLSAFVALAFSCFWRTAIGTDITVCLSQLFGSWAHWWRRVLCCDNCRKNQKPRLDFSSRCLTSLRLACGRISIVEYVGYLSDLLTFWLLR